MKKIIILSFGVMLLFSLISCKKKSEESNLNGSWELRYIAGIQIAGTDPNFKAGNGNIIKFSDHTFEKYENNKMIDSGTFSIQKEEAPVNNYKSNYSIVFNNNTDKVYLNLSGKKLIVFMGSIAADGTESHYEKQ